MVQWEKAFLLLVLASSCLCLCEGFGLGGLVLRALISGRSACGMSSKDGENKEQGKGKWSEEVSLEMLRSLQERFAKDRDWEKHHTPRNIALALVGEVGELAEIFQWRRDDGCRVGLPDFSPDDKVHVGEEMSDVLLYLVRMADVCGVDLAEAVQDKIKKNARKYPADLVQGSSKKYTEYSKQTGTLKRPRGESPPV